MINTEVLVESKHWKKIIHNPKKLVSNILNRFPKNYKFINKKAYISILLTNNKKIKLLNKKFRNRNKSTDILSFPFFDKKNINKISKDKKFYLGDIAISYEEFSKKNKKNYSDGFIKILIHGFLHLLNFDHKLDKDFKRMNSIENKIYKKIKG